MSNAKAKFDKTFNRCNAMIQLYNELKETTDETENIPQDILRGAIVLAVAAFDAYATDCFSEYFVIYIKKYGVDSSLEKLLGNAGFTVKFALELINSERPYRKMRTLIEKYYYKYTTQQLKVIDELFRQYHIKDITKKAAQRSGKNEDRLLGSVEKIIERRHNIVHDGDYNDQNRIKSVSKTDLNRIYDLRLLVENMDYIIENRINPTQK